MDPSFALETLLTHADLDPEELGIAPPIHQSDGLPEDSIDRDRMLTDVSLYWLTGTAGSAAQIYYEEISANTWSEAAGDWNADSGDSTADSTDWGGGDWAATQRETVPTGVLVSAHDVTIRRWAERDHNVVRWTELDRGGHFLSMEAPDLLVDDVREFFRKAR